MYLKKMQLYHFRNFDNTTIDFQDGVNIIVGPNNSGKSNLLCAINMMNSMGGSSGSLHDFNKNDITNNFNKYKTEPPVIEITYYIEHTLSLNNFDDGILRVKNFIVNADDEVNQMPQANDVIKPHDKITVVGDLKDIKKLNSIVA